MSQLDALRSFRAVVEEGAFVRAAERLQLSRAAVSKHVAQLEDHVGTRLLHRTTRTSSLTADGRVYYEHACRMLDELDAVERQLRREDAEPKGTLRVAAPMTYGLARIAPLIGGFCTTFPKLDVQLLLEDRQVDLVREGIDVAIRVTHALPDRAFVARRLAGFRRVLVASPTYLSRAGTPEVPEDLGSHAAIRFLLQRTPDVWVFEKEDERREVRVSGPLSVNSSLAMRNALLEGLGLALIPDIVVEEDLREGRLVVCLPSWSPEPRSVFALYPSRRHLHPGVRAFVDHLATHLGTSR